MPGGSFDNGTVNFSKFMKGGGEKAVKRYCPKMVMPSIQFITKLNST